jgi:hypothetical protein
VEREADAAVYEIAYAEAVRALSEQHAVIDSLRTRAGLLLSSAAVTTSFLAGQAIHGGRVSALAWLALLDFAAVAALVIATLQPRHWEFSAYPDETISTHLAASGRSATELYKTLTARLERGLARNGRALGRLAALVQLAGSLLALEVFIWIGGIATVA